ncbi:class I lanthipeptide [uncultured Bacteroides sp.]|uniref:class I lanthipeptide n=1 Tax=uncultured Bacteroides sp. TaxID=162156 RepID=UPI002674BCDC|nr:class I lanthipeptide [uncultured Bacteroides sp.]
MEEKKKLKKLVLKKEEIVNLNDYEMGAIRGGSWSQIISKSIKYTALVYEIIDGYFDTNNNNDGISQEVYAGGCLLPEVYVTP